MHSRVFLKLRSSRLPLHPLRHGHKKDKMKVSKYMVDICVPSPCLSSAFAYEISLVTPPLSLSLTPSDPQEKPSSCPSPLFFFFLSFSLIHLQTRRTFDCLIYKREKLMWLLVEGERRKKKKVQRILESRWILLFYSPPLSTLS